jgi:peptide/nickel transport system permease protein
MASNLVRFVIRRILLTIPVLIGISVIVFVLTRSIGNPASVYITNPQGITEEKLQEIIKLHHLDEPLYVQYFYWLNDLFHGDLGYSVSAGDTVANSIVTFLPRTLELTLVSLLLAVLFGMASGKFSATHRNRPSDHGLRIVALYGVSTPVFWLGLMLLFLFFGTLGIAAFSPGPYNESLAIQNDIQFYTRFLIVDAILNGDFPFLIDVLAHMLLPALTLSYASMAFIMRMMRSSMLEVLSQPYILVARAKGLTPGEVVKRHATRNAMLPTTTVIGLSAGFLLGGSVLVESVFRYPGLGLWASRAILRLDHAAVVGLALLAGMVYVTINLVVDIAYAYLDPRVALE